MKNCWNCGDSIPDNAPVCETCGAEQATAPGSPGGAAIKAGDVIGGRYEVRADIGEGAVGRVYRAQDREVDVTVALRVIHPELVTDDTSRKQFKAGVRKSREVLHPGCVKIYEADIDGSTAYLTMEFIGGLSLRRLLSVRTTERRPFKLAEIEPMLSQIVAALSFGHSKGVQHLSLSPGNVLIQPEGLKLTDFGLAVLVPGPRRRAAADRYKSTPYVSPQFLNGDAPSPADDIFSLGAVLFEMLTLQTPAPGISPSDVVEGLPEEADDLIADCLAENASKRPRTPAEVLTRLQTAIEREAAQERAKKEAAAKPPPPPPPKPAPVEAAPPPPPPPPPPPAPEPEKRELPPPPSPAPEPPKVEPAPRPSPAKPVPPPPAAAPVPAPAVEPIPEPWSPPPAKKGPPVGIIVAIVVVIAAAGLFFAFSGGEEAASSKPVATAPKTETPEEAPKPEPGKPEPEKPVAEEPKAVAAAPVSITEPESKAETKAAEPKAAPAAEAPKTEAKPAAKPAEEKKPEPKAEKPKAVAASEPPPSSGSCPSGMAFVPGGSFKMGSSPDDSARDFAEKTLTSTGVPDFCIDRYESPNTEGSAPRGNISWNEAKTMCEGQGKRLCSEAEWEKACKGPKESRYPYGDLFNAKSCNTRDQSGQDRALAPSGKYAQCTNSYGAFDMSGNLREWTSTNWSDGSADKVVRGGSHSRPDWATRCAFRENFPSGTKDSQIGFRCCK